MAPILLSGCGFLLQYFPLLLVAPSELLTLSSVSSSIFMVIEHAYAGSAFSLCRIQRKWGSKVSFHFEWSLSPLVETGKTLLNSCGLLFIKLQSVSLNKNHMHNSFQDNLLSILGYKSGCCGAMFSRFSEASAKGCRRASLYSFMRH